VKVPAKPCYVILSIVAEYNFWGETRELQDVGLMSPWNSVTNLNSSTIFI